MIFDRLKNNLQTNFRHSYNLAFVTHSSQGEASKDAEVFGSLVFDYAGKYHRMSGEIIAPNQVRVNHPGIWNPISIRYK